LQKLEKEMNSITKPLLHQTRGTRHALHALVTTKSWHDNDDSWIFNRRNNKYGQFLFLKITPARQKYIIDDDDAATVDNTSIFHAHFHTFSQQPQQQQQRQKTDFFRESFFSHEFKNLNTCTIRNFSSFAQTSSLQEKSSKSNQHDVAASSSHQPDEKDSSSSPDSSSVQDSSDSPVSNKEKFQNAAQRGKTAVSKGAISLRGLIQKYGWTFIGTYMGVYFVTLGTLFVSVDSGLIDPVTLTSIDWPWHSSGVEDATSSSTSPSSDRQDFDSAVDFVASYMKKFPWTAPYSDVVLRNPHMANLGIAWVATKLTEPIRLPVSIAIVRKIKKDKEDA
jgi:hypothetical protein